MTGIGLVTHQIVFSCWKNLRTSYLVHFQVLLLHLWCNKDGSRKKERIT